MSEKIPGFRNCCRFLAPYLRPYRSLFAAAAAATVAAALLLCIEPLIQRGLINALTSGTARSAWWFGIAVAGCIGLRRLLHAAGAAAGARAAAGVTGMVSSALVRRLLELPLGILREHGSGYLSGRIAADCENMQFLYSGGMFGLLANLLRLGGGMIFLFWLDWRVGSAALAVLPFYGWLLAAFRRRQYRLSSRYGETVAENSRQLNVVFGGAAQIKSSAAEEQLAARITDRFRRLAAIKIRRNELGIGFQFAQQLLPGIGQLLLVLAGIGMILRGEWTLGELWALCRYLEFVFAPARDLSGGVMRMHFALAAAARVMALAHRVPEPRLVGGIVPQRLRGGIRFRKVGFAYPGRPRLFRNLSFRVRPGETVALFGASGCGKTTLVNLLLLLLRPDSGEIRIDGVPLEDYNARQLRRRIGYIGQNSEFLRATLRENLCWGCSCEVSPRKLRRALDRVGLGMMDPACRVLENASNFSGGERLRLALARELLRDSDIVILDEATANLDAESEQRILRMVRHEFRSRTVILISHRRRVLHYADRIIRVGGKESV